MDIHEPIKRDRNLNITVIADDSRVGRVAVDHGVMLAEVFQASLTVMTNFGFGSGIPPYSRRQRLSEGNPGYGFGDEKQSGCHGLHLP